MRVDATIHWVACLLLLAGTAAAGDRLRDLQTEAINADRSAVAHWGFMPEKYTQWGEHSNRLIPVFAYGTRGAGPGVDLDSYTGANSRYRDADALRRIYGFVPEHTPNPHADYLDQTNLYDLQMAAAKAGKKHIFLVIFDGMDWQTLQAAAVYNSGRVAYTSGRGDGTHFQDYQAGGNTQFAFMVTSPHHEDSVANVDTQHVEPPKAPVRGGYDAVLGGPDPWSPGSDPRYLVGIPENPAQRHAVADSASSATSMNSGIKTYNGAINVDAEGVAHATVAQQLQQRGMAVGAVSSAPLSHATPAATYANNVYRYDYQDIARDLVGLRSSSHPLQPLPGMEVLIGCGYGITAQADPLQGGNFEPGTTYISASDLQAIDARHGGRYVIALRSAGNNSARVLRDATTQAIHDHQRLLGFFGTQYEHLPHQTANGDYQPAPGRDGTAEKYTEADIRENPSLAEMTEAAISVLAQDRDGFWLMVEAGDVDWANHDNNLDNAIGSVNSGDDAVRSITRWVDRYSNWRESLMIVTADHGHYLFLDHPELLAK